MTTIAKTKVLALPALVLLTLGVSSTAFADTWQANHPAPGRSQRPASPHRTCVFTSRSRTAP